MKLLEGIPHLFANSVPQMISPAENAAQNTVIAEVVQGTLVFRVEPESEWAVPQIIIKEDLEFDWELKFHTTATSFDSITSTIKRIKKDLLYKQFTLLTGIEGLFDGSLTSIRTGEGENLIIGYVYERPYGDCELLMYRNGIANQPFVIEDRMLDLTWDHYRKARKMR